ncbi:MAG: amino acid adenylation domain-containing protein [Candidatus Aminicenantes bacterium]|nr:MAG: amino acid adenylation domain-containing protein [Candidatus Aminicenantes bacterium]
MEKLDKKNIEDILSLTPMQEGMLFHYLQDPGSDIYFEQLSLDISGEIDADLFGKAWNFVIETNEMLRTVFRWEKVENPVQIILKKHQLQPKFFDLSGKEPGEKKKCLEKIKVEDKKEKFDLREVPFRVTLCKVEENKYEMMISNHHILYDGWSTGIILKEFFEVYHAFLNGDQRTKPSLKPSFREFVQWLQDQDKGQQKRFWEGYLSGLSAPSTFPLTTNKRIKGKEAKRIENYPVVLAKDMKYELEAFIKRQRLTLASFFYSAWGILLQRYCNTNDVNFGTIVSGRSARIKGIEDMVGLFINTIPLRVSTEAGEKIKDMVQRINCILPIREKYESTALVDVKEYSELENSQELFDSIIVLENYPLDLELMQKNGQWSLVVESYSIVETTTYPLAISITIGEAIEIRLIYHPALVEKTAISRLSCHFTNILMGILKDFEKDINGIELLVEEEKQQILHDFNDTRVRYPKDKTLQELFEEQVEQTPDHVALVGTTRCPSDMKVNVLGENISITYKELNEKSHQLAHLLRKKGVAAETIVGIMTERSLKMIIGILAVLKAGGAFLPIDTDYPAERKSFMLRDSNTHILLICSPLIKENNFKFNGEMILLDELSVPDGVEMNKDIASKHVNTADDLAYIMYTSGSTGRPKGVIVEHRNVVRLVVNTNYIRLTGETRILQTGAPVFDATTFEIWGALLNGGQLVLVEKEVILDAHQLGQALHQNKINTLWLTSPLFNQLVGENCEIFSNLDYLLVGGDVLSPQFINLVRSKSEKLKIINGYGPTENTTFSTTFLIDRDFEEAIPIGSPITNSTAFVLGPHGELQPVGVFGELWVGGDGVSRGYLNRPELTREKFVNLPCLGGKRLYRTGDITRWLPDGNIQFSRRIDSQVKIRGFRVEPGEIEKYLLENQEVKEALVIPREEETAEKYLCAYIIPDFSGISPTTDSSTAGLISRLQEFLSGELPGYMVPAQFVMLEKIPLNPNGKVDIKALPKPEIKRKQAVVAPRDRVEKQLKELWALVLGMEKERISIDDDFFQLGGHSLKATTLASRIHKVIHVKLPVMEIFNRPTIRSLSQYIKEAVEEHYSSIEVIEEKEYYLLSPAQKRLYFLHRLGETTSAYNISCAWLLEGLLDKDKWEHVFRKLIQRHESLRTSFLIIDEEPVQRIHKEVEFEVECYDAERKAQSAEHKDERHAPCAMRCASTIKNFIRPFDLSKAPLIRVGLLEIGKNKHLFMVDMHHIVSDGTSVAVLVKEFMSLYDGEALPPLRLRYKDCSQWQSSKKQKALIKCQGEYWLEEFAGDIPVLNLPYDFSRPLIQSFAGNSLEFKIVEEEAKKLKHLALAEGSTLYMVLLALFYIFFGKVSGQEDIVVGSLAAGRKQPGLEQIIGIFINTLALRNYPTAEKSITLFLRDVKENTLKAQENQDYPFEDLVELVEVNRDTSRNPLFDVMLVFQNMEQHKLHVPGLTLTQYPYESKKSKFDMTLTVVEHEGSLSFTFTYNRDLFKKTTIQRFIGFFKRIAAASLENPLREIAEIEIIPDNEKKQVLYDFNATSREYPTGKSIHLLFEEQVQETADHIAVVGNPEMPETQERQKRGTAPIQITYKELNARANQLGRLLRAKGVIPDSITGIMTGPWLEMMVGIMAILKAGGSYLPIDPLQPAGRITYMLNDSRASVLLTSLGLAESLPPENHSGQQRIYLDEACIYTGESTNLETASRCQDVLYTIYTSGTTGKSKGTLVENKNLVNYIHWFKQKVHLTENDRTVLTSSFGFDLGYTNIYSSILSGCQLHLIPRDVFLSPEGLLGYMIRHRITYIKVTPSLFSTIVGSSIFSREACQNLRLVLLGGEEIRLKDVEKAHGIGVHMEIMNHYGPTEATIGCVARFIDFNRFDQYKKHPTIGSPIDNMKAVVLDNGLMLVPVGVAGELCVSGAGVARGYLNQPELTAQKFCLRRPGGRFLKKLPPWTPGKNFLLEGTKGLAPLVYRTGDKARWLTSGMIEFLGRIDHQVKIRGYRIETGEVQNQLQKHKAIKEVVVIPFAHSSGDKYLCAYIVWNRDEAVYPAAPQQELKGYLADKLPEYMIPTYFVTVDRLPLTPNGKLNRKLLPKPEIKIETRYAPPRDVLERQLIEIWEKELNITPVGINDNFFDVGGHSLKAMGVINQIHKTFGVEITIQDFFRSPFIVDVARFIRTSKRTGFREIEKQPEQAFYELSYSQKRLWFIYKQEPGNTVYNMPVKITLYEVVDEVVIRKVLEQLMSRHESLRTSFKEIKKEPVQVIEPLTQLKLNFEVLDWCQLEAKEQENRRSQLLMDESKYIFKLEKAPLFRAKLVKWHPGEYDFIFNIHHIISDGWSQEILFNEFERIYEAQKKGITCDLQPLKIQYKDFAAWQNQLLADEKNMGKAKKFWKSYLNGTLPLLNLPYDTPPKPSGSRASAAYRRMIPGELVKGLEELAIENHASLFIVLLAGFNILLSKITGQENIIMAIPAAGRQHEALKTIIGMFVNTLILRTMVNADETFLDFFKAFQDNALQVLDYQTYPMELICSALKIKYPKISVFFNMINIGNSRRQNREDLEDSHIENVQDTKFHIHCYLREYKNGIEISCHYFKDLFMPETIEKITHLYIKVLKNIANEPGMKIGEYSFTRKKRMSIM